MNKTNIIIRDDDYMRIQTPLIFAYNFAKQGIEVDLLFVNAALLVLTEDGSRSLRINGRHSYQESWLKKQLAAKEIPTDVYHFLKKIKQAGRVTLYGCKESASIFKITEEDLIPEADGFVDSSQFITNAIHNDIHCMYF